MSEDQSPLSQPQWDSREANQELFDWPVDLVTHYPQGKSVPPPLPITPETTPEEVLQHYWGYESFRPMQRDIVCSALEGRDTMGLLPTGGGKSITFQVPGLMLPGLTLVVTPLISLMKDQVEHLVTKGIRAAAIHSGMHSQDIATTIDNCIYGRYKFLYVSPERLSSASFRERIEELDISLLVVDECHCICQWGFDFRPSYLQIPQVRAYYPEVPILALTATATPDVVQEIISLLQMRPGYNLYQKSFFRPNLSYSIRYTPQKETMLLHILSRVEGSAIVYCRNRDLTRELSQYLKEHEVSATFFHAGLPHAERALRQERWMRGEIRVMVATNAFGMGIDKPDVRLVVHFTMPTAIEEYFQEAGRAGRDGERAYAVALVQEGDEQILRRRLLDSFPPKEYVYQVYDSLCNYFGIGEGEGFHHSYEYDERLFVYRFGMRPIQTHSAIEIMQAAGFLRYQEKSPSSRLMIVVRRETLYEPHIGMDNLLRTLLRTYTGLFADYVFISEQQIAIESGMIPEEVYTGLVYLNRIGVVSYIPKKDIPRITFLIRREDTKYLYIPYAAYEERKERMSERMEATLRLISPGDVCRSRILLSYFGEEMEHSCGMCDVCLRRTSLGLHYYLIMDTRRLLSELWSEDSQKPLEVESLCDRLGYTPEDLERILIYIAQEWGGFELVGRYLVPIGA